MSELLHRASHTCIPEAQRNAANGALQVALGAATVEEIRDAWLAARRAERAVTWSPSSWAVTGTSKRREGRSATRATAIVLLEL